MEFQSLVGRIFQEMELFELLQFEIETNFDNYLTTNLHIFFDRLSDNSIRVSEVVFYENEKQLHVALRGFLEKREFFEIYFNHGHVDLCVVRFDRSSPLAVIRKSGTFRQDWGAIHFADEYLQTPLTQEEIRMGFAELTGCLEEYIIFRDSKDKKAI